MQRAVSCRPRRRSAIGAMWVCGPDEALEASSDRREENTEPWVLTYLLAVDTELLTGNDLKFKRENTHAPYLAPRQRARCTHHGPGRAPKAAVDRGYTEATIVYHSATRRRRAG